MPVTSSSNVVGVLSARVDLQADLADLLRTTRFNRSGYATPVDDDGRIIAHPDPHRINDDISQCSAVQLGLKGQTGWVSLVNKAGAERLMFYRPVKSPASINPKPWVLLTEIDQGEAMSALRSLGLQFLVALATARLGRLLGAAGAPVAERHLVTAPCPRRSERPPRSLRQ